MCGRRVVLFGAVALFAVLSASGCAYNPPYNAAETPGDSKVIKTVVLADGYEDAWRKAIQILAAEGYNIKVSNKQDGIITTEKKLVRLNETQADCGNIWGIPYTKDKRTTTNAAYSLVLQDKGGRTAVTVNVQIEGIFNATAASGSKQLSCYSLGYLEEDLIGKLAR